MSSLRLLVALVPLVVGCTTSEYFVGEGKQSKHSKGKGGSEAAQQADDATRGDSEDDETTTKPSESAPPPAAPSACGDVKGATATKVFAPKGTDLSAVQDAINAASSAGGGIVDLKAGTFLLDGHLVLKSNVKLVGAGPDKTILKAGPKFMATKGPAGGYPLVTTLGAKNVTIANLTADQSSDTLAANVPDRLAAFFIDVRKTENVVIDHVFTRNPFNYSIAIVESEQFCVTKSNTQVASKGKYNQLDGIHILDSAHGKVVDNEVDQRFSDATDGDDGLVAHTINAPVFDVVYARNKVRGGNRGNGMQLAAGNHEIHHLTIENNEFFGSPFGIRTGYYDDALGVVHDVTIQNNNVHDLKPGIAFPDGGNAIHIYEPAMEGKQSPAAKPINIQILNNKACRAGRILPEPGTGNRAEGNNDNDC